jgi:hypothetical protein
LDVYHTNPINATNQANALSTLENIIYYPFILNESSVATIMAYLEQIYTPSSVNIAFSIISKIVESSNYINQYFFERIFNKLLSFIHTMGSDFALNAIDQISLYSTSLSLSAIPIYSDSTISFNIKKLIETLALRTNAKYSFDESSAILFDMITEFQQPKVTIVAALIEIEYYISPIIDIFIIDEIKIKTLNLILPSIEVVSNKTYQCAYYNIESSDWMTDGCVTTNNKSYGQIDEFSFAGDKVVQISSDLAENFTVFYCTCSHLTPFSLVEGSTLSPNKTEAKFGGSLYHIIPTIITVVLIILMSIAYGSKAALGKHNFFEKEKDWMEMMFNNFYPPIEDNPQEPQFSQKVLKASITPKSTFQEYKTSENTTTPSLDQRTYSIPDDSPDLKKRKARKSPMEEKSSVESLDLHRPSDIAIKVMYHPKRNTLSQLLFLLRNALPYVSCLSISKRFIENKYNVECLCVRLMSLLASTSIIYFYEKNNIA